MERQSDIHIHKIKLDSQTRQFLEELARDQFESNPHSSRGDWLLMELDKLQDGDSLPYGLIHYVRGKQRQKDLYRSQEGYQVDQKVSAWADVRLKAKRITDTSSAIEVTHYDAYEVEGYVVGDHDRYFTQVVRKNAFGKRVTHWSCECEWGYHCWNTMSYPQYVGRFCSHALGLYYRMQSLDFAAKRTDTSDLD